jgi:transposase
MQNTKSKLTFIAYSPNQTLLFPSNLEELIDANHPVRIVDQIIDHIDISPLIDTYKGGGAPSYHPRMMLKILINAYLNNIYQSRRIEAAVKENIHFMWLAGMQKPDHNTINRFRSDRLKHVIKKIFSQVVLLFVEQGIISLKEVYTDGTKIEANANRYTFVWGKTIKYNKNRIVEQLKELWDYTQQVAFEELNDSEDIDFEQISSQKVSETITRIDQALKGKPVDKKVKQKVNYAKKNWPEKIKQYEEQEKLLDDRNSYSKTDTGATFMRMKEDHLGNGQLKPGYNWQISTTEQFCVNYSVHQDRSDIKTLIPHYDQFKELYDQMPEELTTDAGYGSEQNYEYLEQNQIKNFVKYNYFHKEQTQKFKNDISKVENLHYNEEKNCLYCPMGQQMHYIGEHERETDNGYIQTYSRYQAQNCHGCPLRGPCFKGKGNRIIEINHKLRRYRKQARDNLMSEKGLKHRSQRPVDVEPVFGMVKHNRGFKRLLLRGLDKVSIELGLIAIAHNISKIAA